MRRLGALDAQFLYQEDENPAAHMHTLKIAIIDFSGADRPYDFAESKEVLRLRLHRLEPLLWRPVVVPLELHHPVWIDDPNFDLDFHVRRLACPAPGGDRELCEVIADLSGRPLDRSRPLWELYLVEGLVDGCVAAVAKVHHALADGVASALLLELLFDTDPAARVSADAVPPLPSEPMPSRWRLLRAAIGDVGRSAGSIPQIVRITRRARQRKAIWGLQAAEQPPKSFTAPRTSLNRVITPHRSFAVTTLPFADATTAKAAFGCTINDVFLATAAGGLRRWLAERGELPDLPLVGGMPVSIRTADEREDWGNRLGKMYVALRTDLADPVERLRATQRASLASKEEYEQTRGARLENWADYLPVRLVRFVVRQFSTLKRFGGPSSENVVVSNVPGPRTQLYIEGARLDRLYSIGPIMPGVGLNITVWSYCDQLNVSVLACREVMADPWVLVDHLRSSFQELVSAASAQRTTRS